MNWTTSDSFDFSKMETTSTTSSMNNPEDIDLQIDIDNYYYYYSEDISTGDKIILFVVLILIIIGLLGNTLSFCVMMQKEMRQTSTAIYLMALSIADTLCLLGGPLVDMILSSKLFLGWYMPIKSNFTCLLYNFLYYVNPHVSAWCLVAVTIERLLVIYFPHR